MRIARAALLTLTLTVLAAHVASGEPSGAAGAACSEGSVETTVTLDYEQRVLGDVTGLFLEIGYPEEAGVPGKGTDPSVRERVTSVLDARFRLLAVDEDADGDGREDRLRILVTTTDRGGVPPGPVARIRFDCTQRQPPAATGFRCRTDQVADSAAQLMKSEQTRQVTCDVTVPRLAPSPPPN